MAADVNLVWNYCNDLASRIFERERRFASAYELQSYLAGASKAGLRVGSRVFQEVARVFVQQRVSAKRIKLGWRGSRPDRNGFRLGWVPFKAGELRHDGERLLFGGQPFHVWDSYGLSQYELRGGRISEDHCGRWFLSVDVRQPDTKPSTQGTGLLRIDASDPSVLILSDGRRFESTQFCDDVLPKLPRARRAGRLDQVWALRMKVGRRRQDFVHKLSTELARTYAAIEVVTAPEGGVKPRSVARATWASLLRALSYKCIIAGSTLVVDSRPCNNAEMHLC
jgi:putative transposase